MPKGNARPAEQRSFCCYCWPVGWEPGTSLCADRDGYPEKTSTTFSTVSSVLPIRVPSLSAIWRLHWTLKYMRTTSSGYYVLIYARDCGCGHWSLLSLKGGRKPQVVLAPAIGLAPSLFSARFLDSAYVCSTLIQS